MLDDFVSIPAATIDAVRSFRLVNESFCQLLGRRMADVLGRPLSDFQDSKFGAALESVPIDLILSSPSSRDYILHAGQIDGQNVDFVCSVAKVADDASPQVLLTVRSEPQNALSPELADAMIATLTSAGGEDTEALEMVEHNFEEIDGLRDVFFMSLSNRSLRRMLDHVFGQAQRMLHVDAMAVYAPFTVLAGLPHSGKVIYASDDFTNTLLATHTPIDGAVLSALAQGKSHVYRVNADLPDADIALPAAWLVAPMRVNDDIIGLTIFLFAQASGLPSNVDELVVSLAEQAMVAYGADRLQRLAGTAVALHERERLAREMHDAVMQSVYSLTLFAEAGRRLAAMGQIDRVEDNLQMLSETAQQALSEMRLLLYELKPAVLEQAGLIDALRQRLDAVERRTGMIARLQVEGIGQLTASLEDGLYRVCHEALNNTLKHALATQVTVTLRVNEDSAQLKICDNGIGFDPNDPRAINGEGMATMRERVRRMKGKLVVESSAQQGTCVNVLLALPSQHDVGA